MTISPVLDEGGDELGGRVVRAWDPPSLFWGEAPVSQERRTLSVIKERSKAERKSTASREAARFVLLAGCFYTAAKKKEYMPAPTLSSAEADAAISAAGRGASRPRFASHECPVTAEVYWMLRDDPGWEQYVANMDRVVVNVVSWLEEGGVELTSLKTVTAIENPIPVSLRGMLKCKDGFTFELTERWRRDRWDVENKLTFTTKPAVMSDRISVWGAQWVEPSATGNMNGCKLCFELAVKCRMPGVGGAISRGIENGSFDAYKQLPLRVVEYMALRRRATEARNTVEIDTEVGVVGTGGTDAVVGGSSLSRSSSISEEHSAMGRGGTTSSARAAADAAASSRRARIRWHMALMGVRFRRAVQLQQLEEYRLCEVSIDDPQARGFAPRRHTTYRVSTRVRRGGCDWVVVRHRYSDFLALHSVLLGFLPGIELPPLPEKKGVLGGSMSAATVEQRRAMLERFLQYVLDHPVASTADELFGFLDWPDSVRGPLNERAHASLNAPPSMLRAARTALWARRQQGAAAASSTGAVAAAPAMPAMPATPATIATIGAAARSPPPPETRAGFSSALADAMTATAEEAACIVQQAVRSRTASRRNTANGASTRSSGFDDGLAEVVPSPALAHFPSLRSAAAGSFTSAAAGLGDEGREAVAAALSSRNGGLSAQLMEQVAEKLAVIEVRLRRIDARQRRRAALEACRCS
jgi:hypothetical protein